MFCFKSQCWFIDSHFEFYAPGQSEAVLPLRESQLYIEDFIGENLAIKILRTNFWNTLWKHFCPFSRFEESWWGWQSDLLQCSRRSKAANSKFFVLFFRNIHPYIWMSFIGLERRSYLIYCVSLSAHLIMPAGHVHFDYSWVAENIIPFLNDWVPNKQK